MTSGAWVRTAKLGIVLATIAVYANSFAAPFVFDDKPAIQENASIRRLWNLRDILSPPGGNGITVEGRPLLNASLAVNYAISGTRVWSYHALNIVIHALAALALFGIARRTLAWMRGFAGSGSPAGPARADAVAFAVALLWAVHPLQTESVTYVVQRAESLMGLLYLLTVYCFIRYAHCGSASAASRPPGSGAGEGARGTDGGARWAALSILACLLGMATKEVMVSAPLIVLLYDATFVSEGLGAAVRRRSLYYTLLALTEGVLLVLALRTGTRGGTAGFGIDVGPWAYWQTQFQAVCHYLWLSFWPRTLIFDYGVEWVRDPREVIPYALMVCALGSATALALWRRRAEGFLGAFFFAILAPTSLVPGNRQTLAEHRMYLPLAAVAAFCVCGACAVCPAASRRKWARQGALLLIACALALGLLTVRRNGVYGSMTSLYRDTVAKRPGNAFARYNLGNRLAESGLRAEAVPEYEAAIRLAPGLAQAYYNLGNTLRDLGRTAEAAENYERTLRIKPDYADAQNSLGFILTKIPGREAEAIAHFESALRINPQLHEAEDSLANVLASIPGRWAEAEAHYLRAIRLKPDYAKAHNDFAIGLAGIAGREPEAIAQYKTALALDPNFAQAHANLAFQLAAHPDTIQEALTHYKTALTLDPGNAIVRNNFANLLATIPGMEAQAVDQYEAALRVKPDYAEAHNNLANELIKDAARSAEALSHYEAAVRIQPGYAEAHNNLAIAYANLGRLGEAELHFRLAIRIRPDFQAARENLGRLLSAGR